MRDTLHADPLLQLQRWLKDAVDLGVIEPTAMALATATPDGRPSVRMVLLKEATPAGVTFFTNYESRKARELDVNPRSALLFWWGALQRQVRIEGTVELTSREESERYFATRPRESQIGSWASAQSRVLESREALEARVREAEERFADEAVPCPPYWGGYRLSPVRYEFWQGRPNRLHDRFLYELDRESGWTIERLAP